MEPTVAQRGTALTITRERKARLHRDAVLQVLLGPRGSRWLALVGAVAGAVGFVVGQVSGAVVLAVVAVAVQVGVWWWRTGTSLRAGLDVGQTIELDYAATGEISLTDDTEQLWLRPGTARVIRFRDTLTVFTEERSFLVPAELLGEDDVDYLEGRAVSPGEGTLAGPRLPFECRVTPDLQRDLVAAITRVVVRSADFLVVCFVAPVPVVVVALVAPPGTAAIVALVVFVLLGLPSLWTLHRIRATVRASYPVGMTLQGGVVGTTLLLAVPRGTVVLDLRAYGRTRVVGRALVLTLRRRRFRADQLHVVPAALLGGSGDAGPAVTR